MGVSGRGKLEDGKKNAIECRVASSIRRENEWLSSWAVPLVRVTQPWSAPLPPYHPKLMAAAMTAVHYCRVTSSGAQQRPLGVAIVHSYCISPENRLVARRNEPNRRPARKHSPRIRKWIPIAVPPQFTASRTRATTFERSPVCSTEKCASARDNTSRR